MPLPEAELRSGSMRCAACQSSFETTLFQPVEYAPQPVESLTATPDGVASACANHARNVAVTSCQRCGLFICALCDMNVGEGSFCPTCFDRIRAEGTLAAVVTRHRDYAGMARMAVVLGLMFSMMFLGFPFGAAGLYYSIRGIKQRRQEGASVWGMIVILIVALLEMISTFALLGVIFMAGRR